MHVHLHGAATPGRHHVDTDIVGIVHDSANQMFDGVDDDRAHDSSACAGAAADASAPSAAGSDSSLTGATCASADAAFSDVADVSAPVSDVADVSAPVSDVADVSAPVSDVADVSAPVALAAFLAGAFFFLAVVASVLGPPSASASAALNKSSLLGLGSLTLSVPSVPGRPLNFCQSPVIFSSASTGSVG